MNFYNTTFGRRILIRRFLLPKETDKEALLVYARLLLQFPDTGSKKPISFFAGAQFSFGTYCFNEGYVLEARLCQCQSNGLNFVFSNPYKEGEKAFDNVLEKGYVYSELHLSQAKERLLLENRNVSDSSLLSGSSLLHLYHAPILLDDKKIMEVRKEQLDQIQKLLASCPVKEFIFLGNEKKNLPFSSYPETGKMVLDGKELSELEKKDFQDETVFFLVSHEALADDTQRKALKASLYLLENQIRTSLKNRFFADYSFDDFYLSKDRHVLALTTKKGKLSSLLPHLSFEKGKPLFKEETDAQDAIHQLQIDDIRMHMDVDSFLEEKKESLDLGLKEGKLPEEKDIREMLSSMALEDVRITSDKENENA